MVGCVGLSQLLILGVGRIIRWVGHELHQLSRVEKTDTCEKGLYGPCILLIHCIHVLLEDWEEDEG